MSETITQIRERIAREIDERRALVNRMPYRLKKAHLALGEARSWCRYATDSVKQRKIWHEVACFDQITLKAIRRGVRCNAKYAGAQAAFALGLLGLAKGSA